MKKYLSVLIAVIFIVCGLSACGSPKDSGSGTDNKDGLQIVTTIFPVYDWVNNILGEDRSDADVTMLLDNGVDLHSYQPTADDIMKIASCDLFIYVGGESDEWVNDALAEATNKDMVVINLLEALGDKAKVEELIEGMEAEEEEDEEDGAEEGPEYDEHVWLSLRNALFLVDVIRDGLSTVDAGNAESYQANTDVYKSSLAALDAEYEAAVAASSFKTLLFGDRFPFRYLTDDYGLDYYAAFVGCSAETEASFETIVFLANKVDELSLPAIMTIEGSDHKIAETIRDNTKTKDQKILTMDSMQSTNAKDVEDGASYLSIMEENLNILSQAIQ